MPMGTEENNVSQKKRGRRIKQLLVICGLCAIVLVISTYSWFVGMQEVNVDSFEIDIAAADSLQLSLDGENWSDTISFTKDQLLGIRGEDYAGLTAQVKASYAYIGNTNNWPGESENSQSTGLVPLSTIGAMDIESSRMILYEKASLTTTPGGYRLLANRVNNYGETEKEGVKIQDGYLAFDLFVKNFTGTYYDPALSETQADEEAVYLTTTSAVTVGSAGTADTGIENSIRVAFAQIGRVNGFNTNAATIQGITCLSSNDEDASVEEQAKVGTIDEVTGLCRTAQIWEPNDTSHVASAINWYKKSCLPREGSNLTLEASYSHTEGAKCGEVTDGEYAPTYAINSVIGTTDLVDVYDGTEYNGYLPANGQKITKLTYFTDTMKVLKGTLRPTFITLAPNSITKIRVYVYLEGQDIDNYDFSSIGKQVAVQFGLSKERFTTGDIEYEENDGPEGLPPEVVNPNPVVEETP